MIDQSPENILKTMPLTGPCEVDIDKLAEMWDVRWWIAEHRNATEESYRLIVYEKNGEPDTSLKVTISNEQAREIMARLGLVRTQSPLFRSAASWRKLEHEPHSKPLKP